MQNNTHCSAIKYILSKERLNVPVYNLVVFSSKNVSVTIQEDNLTVITFKREKPKRFASPHKRDLHQRYRCFCPQAWLVVSEVQKICSNRIGGNR